MGSVHGGLGTGSVEWRRPLPFLQFVRHISILHLFKLRGSWTDLIFLVNSLLTFACTLAIGASLAEIASIYPTAGGRHYHNLTTCSAVDLNRTIPLGHGFISVMGQKACGLGHGLAVHRRPDSFDGVARIHLWIDDPGVDHPQQRRIHWSEVAGSAAILGLPGLRHRHEYLGPSIPTN